MTEPGVDAAGLTIPVAISGNTIGDELAQDAADFVLESVVTRLPAIMDEVCKGLQGMPNSESTIEKIRTISESCRLRKPLPVDLVALAEDGGPQWDSSELEVARATPCTDYPWFAFENLSYRILLSFTGYWNGSFRELDPFTASKTKSLNGALEQDPNVFLDDTTNMEGLDGFRLHLLNCLWGNRHDLSISSGEVDHTETQSKDKSDDSIEVNDIDAIWETCKQRWDVKPFVVVIVLDNCGPELLQDLRLADWLLTHFPNAQVVLHAKSHPVFVSDAILADIHLHVAALERISKTEEEVVGSKMEAQHREVASNVATRLREYLSQKSLVTRSFDFYSSPNAMWEMPDNIREDFECASLVITKGDANYRRILGDRCWSPFTPFSSIVSTYWPNQTPLLAIRTCKSPIAVGLESQDTLDRLRQRNPTWLVDGSIGMFQAHIPK